MSLTVDNIVTNFILMYDITDETFRYRVKNESNEFVYEKCDFKRAHFIAGNIEISDQRMLDYIRTRKLHCVNNLGYPKDEATPCVLEVDKRTLLNVIKKCIEPKYIKSAVYYYIFKKLCKGITLFKDSCPKCFNFRNTIGCIGVHGITIIPTGVEFKENGEFSIKLGFTDRTNKGYNFMVICGSIGDIEYTKLKNKAMEYIISSSIKILSDDQLAKFNNVKNKYTKENTFVNIMQDVGKMYEIIINSRKNETKDEAIQSSFIDDVFDTEIKNIDQLN